MALKGDLLSADLSTVFQMMAMNRKKGRLVVQDQGNLVNLRRLFIDESQVALLDPPPPRPLMGFLVQTGVVSYEQVHTARTRAKRFGQRPSRILLTQGVITKEDAAMAGRVLEEEEILEIFLWKNVSFTLEETTEAPEGVRFFNVDQLVMEAARRQDEWAHVVEHTGSQHAIYARLAPGDAVSFEGLEAVEQMVLDQVDGIRGSREIMEATGLSRYFVDVSLRGLENAGYVSRLGLAELISSGDELLSGGDVESGIRLFLGALRFDRRNVTIHKRLAGAYLQSGRIAKAAAHYRFCAYSLLAAGHRREAITIYQHVLKLLPTDFRTLERCLALLAEEGVVNGPDDRQTLSQARRLLNLELDLGRDDVALRIAEGIHGLVRDDEAVLELLARLRLRVGRREDAVEAYLSLAEARRDRGDLTGALEIYRVMVGLDTPGRHIYQIKIGEIQRLLERGRRRVRRGRFAAGGAVALLMLGGIYWVYARKAQSALDGISIEEPTTAQGAHELARRFRSVASGYPLTPTAMDARREADKWEARGEEMTAAERRRQEVRIARRREAAELASKKLTEADGWMRAGRLESAADAYRECLEIGFSAGVLWDQREEAEKRLADVEEYLEAGLDLLATGREALEAGRREEAFEAFARVAREYQLTPGVDSVRVPVELTAAPPAAWISVEGSQARGQGTLRTELPLQGQVRLLIRAPGHRGQEILLELPPPNYRYPVVLEKHPTAWVETHEPVTALAVVKPNVVAAVARNGRLIGVDVRRGRVLFRNHPETIATTRRRPLVSPEGILVVTEDGAMRLVDPAGSGTLWRRPPPGGADRLLEVVRHGGDFLIVTEHGRLRRISGDDGESVWFKDLDAGVVKAVVAGGRLAILLAVGDLLSVDAVTGEDPRRVPGPFTGGLATAGASSVLVHAVGSGVQAVDLETGDRGLALGFDEELEAGPVLAGRRIVAVAGRHRLMSVEPSGDERAVALPEPVKAVIPGPGDYVAVRLASGKLLVVDLARACVLYGYEGAEGAPASPVVMDGLLVSGHQDGRLVLVGIP